MPSANLSTFPAAISIFSPVLPVISGTLTYMRFLETYDEVKLSCIEMTQNCSRLKYSTQRENVRQAEGSPKGLGSTGSLENSLCPQKMVHQGALISASHLEKHPKIHAALRVQLVYTAWMGPRLHRSDQPHNSQLHLRELPALPHPWVGPQLIPCCSLGI